MYAIIRSGGKQYRVEQGATIHVEKLPAAVGETVAFSEVLLVAGDGEAQVGAPLLETARVRGLVVAQARDRKVRVFKSKRRKHYRRTKGHRQSYTTLRIEAIEV